MTVKAGNIKKSCAQNGHKLSRAQALFCIMSALALLLTFKYSDIAIKAMSSGMRLCVSTVIPALFPFMVLSELFVSSGAAERLGALVGKPISALLGVSSSAASAVILGMLCGFPIGSKSAVSLYEKGLISKPELEQLCAFCNIPSSAFLVSAVGSTLFGSRELGLILYASHIICALLLGFLLKFHFKAKKRPSPMPSAVLHRRSGFIESFTNAVTGSASSMLFICAFVIFFSAVSGYVRFFSERLSLPSALSTLLLGFFEMTGGASAASSLPPKLALPTIAAITGWSGLSVHFQFVGICKSHSISLKPYFLTKSASALLCPFVFSTLMKIFAPKVPFVTTPSPSALLFLPLSPLRLTLLLVFLLSCIGLCRRRR